jgi:hypothetical protein
MSEFLKAIKTECREVGPVLVWIFLGWVVTLLGTIGKPLSFKRNGLPRNPAKTEKGHSAVLLKCQKLLACAICIMRSEQELYRAGYQAFQERSAARQTDGRLSRAS